MSYEQQCYTWPAIVLLCAAIALVLLGPSAPLGTQQKPGAGEYASRAAGKPGEESKAASNDIVGRLEAHGSSLVEKAVRALEECSERQAEDIDRLSLTSPPVGRVMAFAGEWSPRRADGNQWTEQELSWLLCDGWEWDHPTLSPLSEELKLLKAVLRDATALPAHGHHAAGAEAAVAAPAADLTALLSDHINDISGVTIGSYAFAAYSEVYADRGATLESILTPGARKILPEMNQLCLLSNIDRLHEIGDAVVGHFVTADPARVEPWQGILQENSAGAVAFAAPLFVAQGLDDTLVLPSATGQFAAHERTLGIDVEFHALAHADHGTVAYLALPALMAWLDAHRL